MTREAASNAHLADECSDGGASYVQHRIDDAVALWSGGRREGAFLLAILAVIARARQDFPKPISEGESFRRYIEARFAPRISVEYRGRQWSLEQIFYKWVRCEIVHTGGLPVDLGFLEDAEPDERSLRAGGAPNYRLLLSPAWFHQLIAWAQA